MNSDEAIKFADGKAFELLCQLEACRTERQKERINEEYSFINYVRDLIEKEIPQKPDTSQSPGTFGDCIRCGYRIADFERCPGCGQALDWSGVL